MKSAKGAKDAVNENCTSDMNRGNVLVIYTGGTMGMKRDDKNGALKPEPGYLTQQIKGLPEMANPEMPNHDIIEFDPLIDSSWYTPLHYHPCFAFNHRTLITHMQT